MLIQRKDFTSFSGIPCYHLTFAICLPHPQVFSCASKGVLSWKFSQSSIKITVGILIDTSLLN